MSQTGHTFTLRIESLAYGGHGVGRREDGMVVFIPFAAPGDVARAHSRIEHRSYCEAELEEIITPSTARTIPACSHFGLCGGCDWQHVTYPEQLVWKQRILTNTLAKIPRHPAFTFQTPVPAQRPYHYRCHTRLQYRSTPAGTLGFFRKRSHAVLECQSCPILNFRLQEAYDVMQSLYKDDPLQGITAMEIYAPGDEVLLLAHTPHRSQAYDINLLRQLSAFPSFTGCHILESRSSRVRTIFGETCFTYDLDIHDRTFRLSGGVGGFIQANPEMNVRMVEHVMTLARGAHSVLDLYGGCGNFSLPLATVSETVIAVERDHRLASFGMQNAQRNHVPNMHILCAEARQALINYNLGEFDTIVLDPPREGAKDLLLHLPILRPQRIIYVSCNPTTLARDLDLLKDQGFMLSSLRLFDMFPHTYHIECIALLEK